MSNRTRTITAVAIAAAFALAPAGAAVAQPAEAATTGWLRLAHLSPDTAHVDVTVAAVSGGSEALAVDDVAYGAVSEYMSLPDGTYTVSMSPAGSPDSAPPVLESTVDIDAGSASTLAVFGRNDSLRATAFADDLTPPSDGQARVRLVQASVEAQSVDVRTADGTAIAQGTALGTVTGYAEIGAGPWDLVATADGRRSDSSVDLPGGSVSTLFVLDSATQGLVVNAVTDAAGTATMPEGGVATGGGYLTRAETSEPAGFAAVVVAGGLAAAAAALVVVRARRGAASRHG